MGKYKILAIIPARGGSKELPNKNIRSLLGKPLIAWTIGQAIRSKHIDNLIVSTDSKDIAKIAKKYGARVPFLRPKRLAKDKSLIYDAIMHAVKWFEKRGEFFDIVVLLEPTSPLRKDFDIDNAIEFFIKNMKRADSLVSLGEVQLEKPHILKNVKKGSVIPFMKNKNRFYQRQQLPKVYFPYGVIYISKTDVLKKNKTFYGQRTMPYFIERWQNYEIDDLYDFLCHESILKIKLNKK